jgi:hypothetical protein
LAFCIRIALLFRRRESATCCHVRIDLSLQGPGYLHLDIGLRVRGEPSEYIPRGDDIYSILQGWYVSPWARSVFEQNEIDGIILDTPWHIIRRCVTSILMDVFHGVGIPLGFAFGVAETAEFYQQHYDAFSQLFGIDLRRYKLESDQGPALCSLCPTHGQEQLLCLRHFWISLKNEEFSLAVGNLVKCPTEDEFDALKSVYEIEFANVTAPGRQQHLSRTLGKAGLVFADNRIVIDNEHRWKTVSLWRRVVPRMPSTTNSLGQHTGLLTKRSLGEILSGHPSVFCLTASRIKPSTLMLHSHATSASHSRGPDGEAKRWNTTSWQKSVHISGRLVKPVCAPRQSSFPCHTELMFPVGTDLPWER